MGFKRIDTTANRIKLAMKKAGKKQADIVRDIGIDKGSMSHYVNGKYEPKQDVVFKLARILDVSEMWLWGYDCPMERTVEQKNNDTLSDIVIRLRTDSDFFSLVKSLDELDAEKIASIKHLILAFLK